MNVTREIVTDLWPLYQSGEASAEPRAPVEDFLAEDPEFARALRDDSTAALLEPAPIALDPDHELEALTRYKRELAIRR